MGFFNLLELPVSRSLYSKGPIKLASLNVCTYRRKIFEFDNGYQNLKNEQEESADSRIPVAET